MSFLVILSYRIKKSIYILKIFFQNQYSGSYRNSDNYSSHEDSPHDRKFGRRDSHGYDDDERRSRRYERDRDYRERDYERSRDRSRDRERGRERIRDRSYDRDDDRRERDRDRDRERERERVVSRERDWREEIPNNTLMVRGLDVSVTESEVSNSKMSQYILCKLLL